MKKLSYAILYIALIIAAFWIFFFSGYDPIIINLIILNIIIYGARKPIIIFAHYFFEKGIIRITISLLINFTFMVTIFLIIFTLSLDLFVVIISFLIVATSFTFRKIINNMASGGLMLASEQFEIGDLIETNGIQGRVKEITLNHTQLREFDGVNVIIPNSNVYGSSVIKFTRSRIIVDENLLHFSEDEESDSLLKEKEGEDQGEEKIEEEKQKREQKWRYFKYLKRLEQILESEKKLTRYVKEIEVLGAIKPSELDDLFDEVFDRYEPVFGIRPDYAIDKTRYGRTRIMIYIMSEKPEMILNFMDGFLKDLAFKFYQDKIFNGWKEYKEAQTKLQDNTKSMDGGETA